MKCKYGIEIQPQILKEQWVALSLTLHLDTEKMFMTHLCRMGQYCPKFA